MCCIIYHPVIVTRDQCSVTEHQSLVIQWGVVSLVMCEECDRTNIMTSIFIDHQQTKHETRHLHHTYNCHSSQHMISSSALQEYSSEKCQNLKIQFFLDFPFWCSSICKCCWLLIGRRKVGSWFIGLHSAFLRWLLIRRVSQESVIIIILASYGDNPGDHNTNIMIADLGHTNTTDLYQLTKHIVSHVSWLKWSHSNINTVPQRTTFHEILSKGKASISHQWN